MKKVVFICCAIAAMCASFVSCDEKEKGYEGTNYIYLSSEANSMFDTDDASIVVNVALTVALKEDLVLTFVTDDTEEVISLEGNPVTIKAGEKNGSFTIKTGRIDAISKNYKVTLSEETVLPEKVVLTESFVFTVNYSPVVVLTEPQQEIVDKYKNETGIDISKYLGLVNVSVVYSAYDSDSGVALEPVTRTGQTIILLSEASTMANPVLTMAVNPMGIHDLTYNKLVDITYNNPLWSEPMIETGENEEQIEVPTSYMTLIEKLGWTEESKPEFKMSLDGIGLQDKDNISFVRTETYTLCEGGASEEKGVERYVVPFEFEFSMYEKEKELWATNELNAEEWLNYDATVDPYFNLNNDSIDETNALEEWESESWVPAVGTISAEKMEFTFCTVNYNDYDFTKVVATYTPNK